MGLLAKLSSSQTLVSDGAWGTFLHLKGLGIGDCPELWNATHPDDVLDIARSYAAAGCDMIETNSFGGSRIKLAHYGLGDRTAELNARAAALSRRAAGPNRCVLGSIGPTGVILMMGEVPEEEVYESFSVQAVALERGGADVACVETMSALDEASLAVRAVRENTKMEIVCTFTFERTQSGEYRTMMGVSPTQMAQEMLAAGAQVVGTNCGNGMLGMIEITREIRAAAPDTPILVHSNAGLPIVKDGVATFPEGPEEMALLVPELIKAGANVVGGCCGTTPDHIRALCRALGRE